jgi:tetratricopeptide (TPR) repeat protein
MALRGLLDQSLTTLVDAGMRCIQTHGVLLASVVTGTPPDQATSIKNTAARLLDAVVPAIPERGPQDVRLRLLAPHVLALLRKATEGPVAAQALDVAVRLAIALHRTGDYTSALEMTSDAAVIMEPVLGPEHRLVLFAKARAARALYRLGRYEESEALHRRVLADRERLFGPDDPDTLDSDEGISRPLTQLSRKSEGLELLRRAVVGRERVLGPAHPLTLRARLLLLEHLPAAELAAELDGAEMPLPQECALELGADHSITLSARLNYTVALFTLGRFEAAVDGARLVAEEHEQRFGPEFPITLSSQMLYAQIKAALGDVESAIELLSTVVDRRERILGAQHPFTAITRTKLEELRLQVLEQSADS